MPSQKERLNLYLRSLYILGVSTPLASAKWLVRGPEARSWSLRTSLVANAMRKLTAIEGVGYKAPLPPLPMLENVNEATENVATMAFDAPATHAPPEVKPPKKPVPQPIESTIRVDAKGYTTIPVCIPREPHLSFLRSPIYPYSHTYADPKTGISTTTTVEPADVNAYWIVPPELKNSPHDQGNVILAMHGGGYAAGYPLFTYFFKLARKARCRILTINYRLGKQPQSRFPAPIQDAAIAYSHLLITRSPSQITFLGDSAGGGLACALCLYLTSQSLPLPGKLCLLSPWVDLTGAHESHKEAALDYLTPVNFFGLGGEPPHSPARVPELADWKSVGDRLEHDGAEWPKTLIVWGDYETLAGENASLAQKLVVDARLREDQVKSIAWKEMIHDFGFLPIAEAADLRTVLVEWLEDRWEEARIARFRARRSGRARL